MAITKVPSDFCVAKSSGHSLVVILFNLSTFVTGDSRLTYRIPYYLGFPPTSLVVISSSRPQVLYDLVPQAQPS